MKVRVLVLSRILSSEYCRGLGWTFKVIPTTLQSAQLQNQVLPLRTWDRVHSSVKAGESDMRFRKRLVSWVCTSFTAQVAADIHCFPHSTTSMPFLGFWQIGSALPGLLSDLNFSVFSPHYFSKMGLCHLLSSPAGCSLGLTLCLHKAQDNIGCCGTKHKKE